MVQNKVPARIEVIDGNLVTTKTQAPWELAAFHAVNLAGAAFSFTLSRKLKGFPRHMLVVGSVLRVLTTGMGIGIAVLKYGEAAAQK